MKLYFSPGACSLASHIALREAGLTFEAVKVEGRGPKTAGGENYAGVTAKGYVPALRLDDGQVLTEGTAILPYIADQAPASKLAPACGTMPRYRLHEWLGYINSEVHKPFLMGNDFTVADAYLFTVLSWLSYIGDDLFPWPWLKAFQERVAARPAVVAAMKAEGLIK